MSGPVPDEADRKLARNERVKLLAGLLNTIAASCVTVGLLTPLAALLYDLGGARGALSSGTLLFGIPAYLVCAGLLHLIAQRFLGRLRA